MTCPRCGVVNKAGQTTCSRCSGSLAPSPTDARRPHPVLPITKRAEVTLHRARRTVDQGGAVKASTSGPAATAAGVGASPPPGPASAHAEIYLLATERSTGQPAPPDAVSGPAETSLGERRGRMAIGLSGA